MLKKAKDEHVTVMLESVSGDRPKFSLHSPIYKNGKLKFKNDNHPGFDVYFHVLDLTGNDYRFPASAADALAAAKIESESDRCPVKGQTFDEFQPKEVCDQGKTLRVYDPNTTPAEFGFTLFVEKAGLPTLALDPIGENQNGTRSDWVTYAAIAVGSAAVTAVALSSFNLIC